MDILLYYARREDVLNKNVLYICENETIQSELQGVEEFLVHSGRLESTGLYFQFITYDSFCRQFHLEKQQQKASGLSEKENIRYEKVSA